MTSKQTKQLAFDFPNGWGGRRKGAGRKPKGKKAGVRPVAYAHTWLLRAGWRRHGLLSL